LNGSIENNNEQQSTQQNDSVESPKARTEQIFQKMDLDKNGVISESEFINGCLQDKFLYQMLTADYSENF
jgi:Ca2+-binding EF-hand superfamily protein